MPEYQAVQSVEDLQRPDRVRFLIDMFHRIIIHHALWFTEVRHQMGTEKAFEALQTASAKSIGIQLKRLSDLFGIQLKDGLPEPWLNMPEEMFREFMEAVAKNWLANDGVWFQAVEFSSGMTDAKRCNDTCWAHFSPFEARSIKQFLSFPENPGLEGLKKALRFRIYAQINRYSIVDDGPDAFVFQMNECRVQEARKRKGLPDYPCKSAGVVEYPYFAREIDPRITTECVGCPPDDHPAEWYCAWRFSIDRR